MWLENEIGWPNQGMFTVLRWVVLMILIASEEFDSRHESATNVLVQACMEDQQELEYVIPSLCCINSFTLVCLILEAV